MTVHANILISETNARSDFKDLSVLGKLDLVDTVHSIVSTEVQLLCFILKEDLGCSSYCLEMFRS